MYYYQVSRATRRLSRNSVALTTTFRTLSSIVLPDDVAKKVITLKCPSKAEGGVCDVFLVGTHHRAPTTVDLVRHMITYVKPQVVFLEYPSDLAWHFECDIEPEPAKLPTIGDMWEMWRRKMTVMEILLAYREAQRQQITGVNEFFVAHREAAKSGAKVILGDLSQQILQRRLRDKMPVSTVESSMEIVRKGVQCRVDDDVDFDQIAKYNQLYSEALPPDFVDVCLHGRDKHMSSELLKVARKHESVVAFVGFGHLPGIKMNFEQQSTQAAKVSPWESKRRRRNF